MSLRPGWLTRRSEVVALLPQDGARRVLFPFTTDAISRSALDAALRLARAEQATLLPVVLASVPHQLPLDSALPRQAGVAMAALEAVEQRATSFGVAVDSRVERGRNARHALRTAITRERFDRIVIAAAAPGGAGFGPDDVAWLLSSAPGEIVVLRAGDPHADPLLDDELEPAGRPGASGRPGRPGRPGRETTALPSAYV